MQLFELFGSIVIDSNGAKKQISDVTGHAEKSGGRMSNAFGKVGGAVGGMVKGIGKVAGAVGVFRAVDGAINMVSNSIGGAVSRVDTLNRFPAIIEQMGGTAEQAQASINKLADGIDGLPTTLDEIAGSTQRMYTILGDVDLATDSTLALNNAFLASGASSTDASRGLEQYMQMLSTGTVDMQSWRTLQETMPYALKETAEAFGFTGESATNDFYQALKDGEITMDEMNAKMIELSDGTGGFAEVAKTATRGIGTSWQNIQTAIVNGVAGIIQSFDDWLASNGFGGIPEVLDRIKDGINTMFGVAQSVLPQVLDTFLNLYEGIKGLFSGEGFDMSSIINNLGTMIPQFIQKGQEFIQGLVDGIVTNLPQITETIVGGIQTYIENMAVIYPMILNAGVEIITSLLDGIVQAIPTLLSSFMAYISTLVDTLVTLLPMILDAGINIVMSLVQGIAQMLPQIINMAVELIVTLIEGIVSMLPQIIDTAITLIDTLVNTILELLPTLIPVAINLITTLVQALIGALPQIIQAGIQILLALINGIIQILPQLLSTAITLIIELVGALLAQLPQLIVAGIEIILALIGGLIKAIPQLVGAIPQIVTAIFDAFANVNWWEIGKGIIDGIAKGIGDFASNIISKGKEVAENALGGIKKFLGINSPSRLFRDEIGKWIPAGIAVGIEESADLPEEALRRSISVDNMDFSGTMYRDGKSSETPSNSGNTGVTQHITIHSPRPLNPLETARQVKRASRELALEN